jgi:hypothetical protein
MEPALVSEMRQLLEAILKAIHSAAQDGKYDALAEYKTSLSRLEELAAQLSPEESRLSHFLEKHGFSQALQELEDKFPSTASV